MEDKVGSTSVITSKQSWIVGPRFDIFLLANAAWPLLLLPGISTDQDTAVDFWQVYFLTLPHRWITLFLVAIDPDRRQQKTPLMLGLMGTLGVLVVCSFCAGGFGLNAFLCLGFVDYVWNGWHFGSQHSGVLRIYSRKVGYGNAWLDRWAIRTFVFLTILRTSSALLWPRDFAAFASLLACFDWVLLGIPIVMLSLALLSFQLMHLPRLIYLASVCLLYSAYLMASHFHVQPLILCLATAASLFHAVEYLAIVTHYAIRRGDVGSAGTMRWLAQRWSVTLACFVLTVGMLGVYLTGCEGAVGTFWQGLNLWAALVHYSFDGMIWKLRQPATAQSLGVT